MIFFKNSFMIITAIVLVAFFSEVRADYECLSDLTGAGFIYTMGLNNILTTVDPELKDEAILTRKFPSYEEFKKRKSDEDFVKSNSVYVEGYYNHLLMFSKTSDVMLSPITWCNIINCQRELKNSEIEFSYLSVNLSMYFKNVVKNVGLENEEYTLCTLKFCDADLRNSGFSDDVDANYRYSSQVLSLMKKKFPDSITELAEYDGVNVYPHNYARHLTQNKIRKHLFRTPAVFCAIEVCQRELALAGFRDLIGKVTKKKIIPKLRKNEELTKRFKDFANNYLEYVKNIDENEDYNTDLFDTEDNFEEVSVDEDNDIIYSRFHTVKINIEFTNFNGLPMYFWCMVQVCQNDLKNGGFIYNTFVDNFVYMFDFIEFKNYDFTSEFVFKYYEHLKKLYHKLKETNSKAESSNQTVLENKKESNYNWLPADEEPRDPLEWCKFTVLRL